MKKFVGKKWRIILPVTNFFTDDIFYRQNFIPTFFICRLFFNLKALLRSLLNIRLYILRKPSKAAIYRWSDKKVFWKYTASLQENTNAEVRFEVALQLYWNHNRQRCSPLNLLHISRTPFYMNTHGWLLLLYVKPRLF